jgi:hydrogenase expression/formation protein HypD
MRAILSAKNDKIDAFLCPGHVSAITGYGVFGTIVEEFGRPCVVAGFEAMQVVEALAEICRQLIEGRAEVKSMYSAVVTEKGNVIAQRIVADCFDVADGWWRGLGKIEKSVLKLKEKYERFDAFKKFGIEEIPGKDISGCQCGQVLCGLIEPDECVLFGKKCRPETPVGPCMVSSEGACSAWYKYGGR